MAFLVAIVFEAVVSNYWKETSDEIDDVSGQMRDTDVGFQRYHDENELDVGLGKVKD